MKQKTLKLYVLNLHLLRKSGAFFLLNRPSNTDKEEFLDEISVSLNKILGKYDNIILAGDLNIDELRQILQKLFVRYERYI